MLDHYMTVDDSSNDDRWGCTPKRNLPEQRTNRAERGTGNILPGKLVNDNRKKKLDTRPNTLQQEQALAIVLRPLHLTHKSEERNVTRIRSDDIRSRQVAQMQIRLYKRLNDSITRSLNRNSYHRDQNRNKYAHETDNRHPADTLQFPWQYTCKTHRSPCYAKHNRAGSAGCNRV